MRANTPRFLRIAGCTILALILGAGCIDFQESILIKPDGSGMIGLQYSVDEQLAGGLAEVRKTVDEWQTGAALAEKGKALWIGGESAARKYFAGDGITVNHYAVATTDGRSTVQIVCDVADVQKALATGKFGNLTLARNDHGDFDLRADLPDSSGRPSADDARSEQFKALTRGLKLAFRVQTPTAILSAAGATLKEKENRADWLFDAATDDSFLRKMPRIELVFSGTGLDWDKKTP